MTSFQEVFDVLPRYERGQAQAGVELKSTGGISFKALSHVARKGICIVIPLSDATTLRSASYIYESRWNDFIVNRNTWIGQWIPPLKEYASNYKVQFDDREEYINSIPDEKDRKAFIKARIGQGKFRDGLIEYWDSKCSVTGCKMINVLIASHIKPWCDCDVEEALNHLNGLLLMPNLDALFDKGFISFDDDGKIIISSQLSSDDLKKLGVNARMKLRKIPNKQRKAYLEYHRKHILSDE